MLDYTICFMRRGEQLLMLNRHKAPHQGIWNGVGGKIEPGESPAANIIREVREETGIRLESAGWRGVVTWDTAGPGDSLGGMYVFAAVVPAGAGPAEPVDTDEGILAWKRVDWLLQPSNQGVAPHVKHFLPYVLRDARLYEHRCVIRDGRLLGADSVPLRDDAFGWGEA